MEKQENVFVGAAFLLVSIGYLFSISITDLVLGYANLCFLFVLYLITYRLSVRKSRLNELLWGWTIATTFGAIITVVAYVREEPLLFGVIDIVGEDWAHQIIESEYFYRATYYYAGFFFLLGTSILFILSQLLRARINFRTFFAVCMLIVLSVALFLNGNKSAILSVCIAFGFLGFAAFTRRSRISDGKRSRLMVLVAAPILLGSAYVAFSLLSETQSQASLDRFGSLESLEARLAVYESAFDHVFTNPSVLVFGLGPEATIRSSVRTHPDVLAVTMNKAQGESEGAIDSGVLTLLVELGLPLFCLAIWLVISTYAKLDVVISKDSTIRDSLKPIMVFWGICALTQVIGFSKMSWFLVQFFAVVRAQAISRGQEPG